MSKPGLPLRWRLLPRSGSRSRGSLRASSRVIAAPARRCLPVAMAWRKPSPRSSTKHAFWLPTGCSERPRPRSSAGPGRVRTGQAVSRQHPAAFHFAACESAQSLSPRHPGQPQDLSSQLLHDCSGHAVPLRQRAPLPGLGRWSLRAARKHGTDPWRLSGTAGATGHVCGLDRRRRRRRATCRRRSRGGRYRDPLCLRRGGRLRS